MAPLAAASDSFVREAALWWGAAAVPIVIGLLTGVFARLGKIHKQNKGIERQTKTSNGKTLAQIIEDMAFRQQAIEEKQETLANGQETLANDQAEMRRELDVVKGSLRSLQGSVSALAIHVGVEERDRATSRRRRQQTERQQKGTVK